ncbi:MAG: outer membrane protein assembly factor BamE [Rhodospirillales bacterium]|nr:outer membrane protein assembly factor BamE [Rhodospirillales bacterium]
MLKKRRIFNYCPLFLCVVVLALSLSACESRKSTRGNLVDPERVVEIRPGEQSREEVAEILGSPSSVTPFGSDTWYYISQRIETFAFFAPKVLERQIVVVSFDKKGKVAKIDTQGMEKGQAIIPVSRATPTHGNKLTVLEQLVGNLGRFKKTNSQKSGQ